MKKLSKIFDDNLSDVYYGTILQQDGLVNAYDLHLLNALLLYTLLHSKGIQSAGYVFRF
jgi:hypothetical protein